VIAEPPLSGAVNVILTYPVAELNAVTGAAGTAGICAAKIVTAAVLTL
jgi:hypothetical protein